MLGWDGWKIEITNSLDCRLDEWIINLNLQWRLNWHNLGSKSVRKLWEIYAHCCLESLQESGPILRSAVDESRQLIYHRYYYSWCTWWGKSNLGEVKVIPKYLLLLKSFDSSVWLQMNLHAVDCKKNYCTYFCIHFSHTLNQIHR